MKKEDRFRLFCGKLAKKNKFCRLIATFLLVLHVFVSHTLYYYRFVIARTTILLIMVALFFVLSTYVPMQFTSEKVMTPEVEYESDMASLDDLVNADAVTIDDETSDGQNFDRNDWRLLLVNKTHKIPSDYTFSLGTIKGNLKCDERIVKPLVDMFIAAQEEEINLVVRSPYRDIGRQEYLFDKKINNYIKNGYSYLDAYKLSSAVVTVPGTSEHQIGISLDITCDSYPMLDEGFAETEAGKWLLENSYKYGFILRYPKDKEDVTGIIYEPWHYRYVGPEAAEQIMKNHITLEEFLESI